eukprot:COSAG01_NODE_9970_length_2288_cov_11.761207_1_plen_150_part_00
MKRSLLTGLAFALPLPVLGVSVHISFTFSNTCTQRDSGHRYPSASWQGSLLDAGGSERAHHVAVPVECFHTSEQLLVVTAVNQYLRARGAAGQALSLPLSCPSYRLACHVCQRARHCTCVLFFTDSVRRNRGPDSNSSGFGLFCEPPKQ